MIIEKNIVHVSEHVDQARDRGPPSAGAEISHSKPFFEMLSSPESFPCNFATQNKCWAVNDHAGQYQWKKFLPQFFFTITKEGPRSTSTHCSYD